MRISDWSSDVCSSDLEAVAHAPEGGDQHDSAVRRRDPQVLLSGGDVLRLNQPGGRIVRQNDEGEVVRIQRLQQHEAGLRLAGNHRQAEGLVADEAGDGLREGRSEEHTSELQSLMRISYAVFCLKKKKKVK